MELIITVVLAILGSQAIAAAISALINRRKTRADKYLVEAQTARMQSEDARTETAYWKEQVDDLVSELRKLQTQVNELERAIDQIRTGYEQRIAGLHDKIGNIIQELDRANAALNTANKTIAELRDRIEAGNLVITELRKEISTLLIKAAGTKG
jgi:chromosome segregation ATPase